MPDFVVFGRTIAEILLFNCFQNGDFLHLGFLKIGNFNG